MSSKSSKHKIPSAVPTLLLIVISFLFGIIIWTMQVAATATIESETSLTLMKQELLTRQWQKINSSVSIKPPRTVAKGVYLTAYSAGSPKKRKQIIDLISRTELNTVVIDIKDASGYVLYDSEVPMVVELGVKDVRIKNLKDVVDEFHEAGIYVMVRQQVMQDPALARKKTDLALKSIYGGLWRNYNGLAWVDPANKAVWDYNIEIAKEVFALGVDEVNFDYVRYPSDGNLRTIAYSDPDKPKYETMRDFFVYLSEELTPEPGYISVDLFGFVMERYNGLSIGQRLEDTVDVIDYISPMMYPSHYPKGHLQLANPAANPGVVITYGMEQGTPYFEGERAEVRPWIQAFNIGAQYGATNIRAQIDAIEKFPNAGWLLWNASNRYTSAGLRASEE